MMKIIIKIHKHILQGSNLPAFYAMATHWIPLEERGFLYAIILAGEQQICIIQCEKYLKAN